MGLNAQHLSPMSRALEGSEYCAIAAPAKPLANVQGAGNVALGGCGSPTNSDACAASGPIITN